MTDIDYEALSDAYWAAHATDERRGGRGRAPHAAGLLSIVAALRDQGLVVVDAEVLRGLVDAAGRPRPVFPPYLDAANAALAAPGDGETT